MPRLGAGKGIMEFRTRNIHVGTRLNEAEHKKLMELCQRTGLGTTRLLRQLITEAELKAKPTPELREVLRAVDRIGNNLNQLTTLANMKQITVVYLDKVAEGLANISAAVRALQEYRRW